MGDNADGQAISVDLDSRDNRRARVTIPDEAAFESMRDALDDPLWMLGASWKLLTTNDYKRGRFVDALGAWFVRQQASQAADLLTDAGIEVEPLH